ncbi:ABC transporter ATP-binding protein [Paenibacillus sp.]|uniref:ABC transporter ATP-binding protein n=1 Tax=Paenibacillus sp. TaxID=58172 RepID=UPI0028117EFB|nr:ABC transporter ATP-binding protein [Paenibacillus sp.]
MSELTLESVTKQFRGVEVLSDIRMDVKDGEFICLLGPSGSGKSTILRIVGGFEHADSGSVRLDGRDIQELPPNKRNFGFVFQDYALFPHMTVEGNIAFGLKTRKLPSDVVKDRIRSALKLVGLTGLEKRYPAQLSGGQRQRVAIARVVALQPSLLLFDEPLSNLDAKLRRQIRIEMKTLQQELGITTIMVTHDQEEAVTLGDRIAVLQNGVIQQYGAPLELYNAPANAFVAGFLGDPPINFLNAAIETEDGRPGVRLGEEFRALTSERMPASTLPKEAVVGIRPEDIRLSVTEGVPGVVKIVERLGAYVLTYVAVAFSETPLCCLAPNEVAPQVGQRVRLRFDPDKTLVFDARTTKLLPGVRLEAPAPIHS